MACLDLSPGAREALSGNQAGNAVRQPRFLSHGTPSGLAARAGHPRKPTTSLDANAPTRGCSDTEASDCRDHRASVSLRP